jgi:hypothetical protein
MELAQVTEYFNKTPVQVWDRAGSTWVNDVAQGNLQVFDRFISDRSFGQRKRNFIVGGSAGIPAQYDAIKLPTGHVYLIESKNVDMQVADTMSSIYLLHEAPFTAQVKRTVTTPRSNGAPGTPTPTVIATEFADMDRYSFMDSDTFDALRYSTYTVYMSNQVDVTTNDWLVIDGKEYDVREQSVQLNLVYLRVTLRGVET